MRGCFQAPGNQLGLTCPTLDTPRPVEPLCYVGSCLASPNALCAQRHGMLAQGWSQQIQLWRFHGQPSADAWFQPTLIHALHPRARVPPTALLSFFPAGLPPCWPLQLLPKDTDVRIPRSANSVVCGCRKIKERLLLGLHNCPTLLFPIFL